MPPHFVYYKNDSVPVGNFHKALEFLKKEQLILDAKCLTLIQAAESGDTFASHDLHCAFKWGYYGLHPNYRLALYFLELSTKNDGNDISLNFHSTCCLGDTHYKFGKFDVAKNTYIDAIKIMVNLPLEKWDFGIIQILVELTARSKKEV